MKKLLYTCHFLMVCVSISVTGAERGYGDWPEQYPDHPGMWERRIIVLTNACRISPTEYRDKYLVPNNSQASDILLHQNYPATDALYWQVDLNRVAKVHAVDMANNHGLSHSSSDGTSAGDRIKSYYTKSSWWGENIATGGKDAFYSMQQWLLDVTNGNVAPDNSGDDGHRKNIMNSNYKELGTGYAYGPIQWNHFWVQDFAAGDPEFDNPISGAAHFIMDNNKTLFMANYSDPKSNNPQKREIVIDDANHDLTLLMGEEKKGTYSIEMTSADDCRYYYFRFTDSEGNTWRHPEGGELVTLGEGTCEEEYEPPVSVFNVSGHKFNNRYDKLLVRHINNNVLIIEAANNSYLPQASLLVNCKGQVIKKQVWNADQYVIQNGKKVMRFYLDSQLSAGTYFLVNELGNCKVVVMKVIISDL